MFQLTKEEVKSLKCQNGISNSRGGDRYLPYVFTEQGVSMLSGLLRSETAIQANILIMRAFVDMRRFLVANAQIFQRLDRLDRKQLENERSSRKYSPSSRRMNRAGRESFMMARVTMRTPLYLTE